MPGFCKVMAAVVFFFYTGGKVHAQEGTYDPGIIPMPERVERTDGQFLLSGKTVIRADDVHDKAVLFFIRSLANEHHIMLHVHDVKEKAQKGNTTLIEILNETVGEKVEEIVGETMGEKVEGVAEGYQLTITPQRVTLKGRGAGLFYGVQSLLQLLTLHSNLSIPCMRIADQPRFAYRGLMLDVSRHFFGVATVKQVLDLMAFYKLNTFHWHLTDNEGWRIEIKQYPELTAIGSYHVNTVLDGDRDGLDSVSTGGFYTQDQIRDIVQYAADRCITVVPEIEMPAHSAAALRAEPGLKCPLPASSPNQGANNILYCPTEETFTFLENVLTEVIALFPGKYIHIGGDEANKKPWEESPWCQALIKQLGLKDEHALQSYFIQRIEKFLNARGRSIIGWDEILEGGLAPNATVMSWRGEQGGIAAARQHHKVIMSPGPNGLYFDHYQSNSAMEPFNHEPSYGGYAPLAKTYRYDPVPSVLSEEEKKYIYGVQANVWAEHIPTTRKLQYMLLPRIFALSEIAWTQPGQKPTTSCFEEDVLTHLQLFEQKGFQFRVPTAFSATDTVLIGSKIVLAKGKTIPGSTTYYTLDGHCPTENDRVLDTALTFYIPLNERRELQTVVITATGKRSVPTRTVMYNYAPFPALDIAAPQNGMDYQDTGIRMVCQGYFNAINTGIYRFFLPARDGNVLFIDGRAVIADNSHFSRYENMGAVPLQQGFHVFRLEYINDRKQKDLSWYLQTDDNESGKQTESIQPGGGQGKTGLSERIRVPAGLLYHQPTSLPSPGMLLQPPSK